MSPLKNTLSQYWNKIQGTLFPWLKEELDPFTEKQQQLITILEISRIEQFLPDCYGCEGRPQKGEERPISKPTRIERQLNMTLDEIINDLPKACDKGAKKDSKGNTMYWAGYKLHMDTIDGGIPVSAIVTSASVHDSQVAIPLAILTAKRITNCYDLMDSAYDVPAIATFSQSLGHVPLIDKNPRRDKQLKKELELENIARKTLNFVYPETLRYNCRSTAERANARLKDEFGASKLRVRGYDKVACHLMLGVLVLVADQLMKLVL